MNKLDLKIKSIALEDMKKIADYIASDNKSAGRVHRLMHLQIYQTHCSFFLNRMSIYVKIRNIDYEKTGLYKILQLQTKGFQYGNGKPCKSTNCN